MRYEDLKYSDEILPIIFRKDVRSKSSPPMLLHWHEAVELLFITEGEVLVQSNTETATAHPGDMVCVHSGHLHGYNPMGERCAYYCLILPPEVIGSQMLYQSALPLVQKGGECISLYRKVVDVLEEQPPFYKELAKSLLQQLYIALVACGGDQLPGTERRMTTTVKAALEYIEAHYNEELDVDRIARAVGVSRYHLCHVFKELTGKTLAGYWQSVRCNKARKLLLTGASVAEAAEASGFSSPGYFARVYQKHYSVLPSNDKV